MPVSERIEYIKKHRVKGDIKSVSDELSLNYNTVRDIIFGKLYGSNGDKVLNLIENIIYNRLRKEEKERKKFLKKLQN